ncbi:type I restriction endonuclease subunit R [Helcococcus kunzii]|uniref:type I restriction endonuclease subunit R n=1 Tax=Helcococcus kunzii TaxID=40091 RepID=UPI0024AD799A|nr:HsdR family type I site-specific deoxyribonuclease [Helcococcus kunzii]
MGFTTEKELEDKLIERLTMGKSQWTYREDLNTEEKLWANLKNILERNNTSKLNDVMLSETEFRQVKSQLDFSNFYEAAKFLNGENGIAKVEVRRDDPKLGTIRLHLLNSNDIAGGSSVYQVINQFESDKRHGMDRNRRFDVTLLINGLPLIHVELKNKAHPYMDGFRQVKKYIEEDKFTGIFSAIQMFVISNGVDTRYIASSKNGLNEKFLSVWVDENNNKVSNLYEFADAVLRVPEAHLMISDYSVLDKQSKSIILLRPYQIHAINAVKSAIKRGESGYIWHTTGSGKTLTSYKVAKNLLKIPSLDKAIFIVDRVDLDQQTTSSFLNYSENDLVTIDETDDTFDLENKLVSSDRTVIITTIQKLNTLIRKINNRESNKKYEKIKELKLAFVVDECHRAVSPEKQREIKRFFRSSLWFGFTGTPIFVENAKAEKGDLARTTEAQYGKVLHTYTVKEAIENGAVLGFQMEYKNTIDYDDFRFKMKENGVDLYNLTDEELEAEFTNDIFDNDTHKLQVINSIINRSDNKLGLNKGPGQAYCAILTTSSIKEAQRYFELFQDVKNGNSSVKISERVKSQIVDFPKVAITYSISENEERSISDQKKMKESLQIYNEMFDTTFNLETERAYNRDLNNRLQRKMPKYKSRSEQLDIVIVVDRLLTGFDAPCLSTLFIDRSPMPPHNLIQAFSRTNRIFDSQKIYGQVVTFRMPNKFRQAVEDAIVLYSNGGEDYVQAPSFDEAKKSLKETYFALMEIAPVSTDVSHIFGNKEAMIRFARAFQKYDKAFSAIKVYSEYYETDPMEIVGVISDEEFENYSGNYHNIIEELKRMNASDDNGDDVVPIDVEYQIQTIQTEQIDYNYIVMLLQSLVPSEEEIKANKFDEVEEHIQKYRQNKEGVAEIMSQILDELKDENLRYKYKDKNMAAVINQEIEKRISVAISEYAHKYQVREEDLEYYVNNYNPSRDSKTQIGASELMKNADFKKYKETAENPVSKLKYNRIIREETGEFVETEISPYMREF